ncbi:MAG: acetylornithine deacetylase [Planctomycetes bacterium]|nr:acetylornithine deacetylase [Planctomycetota bacterium]
MGASLSSIELLERLIAFDSVSSRSNLPLVEFVADYASSLGPKIIFDHNESRTKANLVLQYGPDEPGGLVLSGHTDVVPVEGQRWLTDPFRLTKGELGSGEPALFGRGTCDMKSFIAHSIDAISRIDLARLSKPVFCIWSYDEEVGCLGAKHLAEGFAHFDVPTPASALIGEPTDYGIIVAHKGHGRFRIVVRGKAGHSGKPDSGLNAIEVMGDVIALIRMTSKELRADALQRRVGRHADFFPDYPFGTINLGTVRGGSAINIIAEECVLDVGYRTLPGDDPAGVMKLIEGRIVETVLPEAKKRFSEATISIDDLGNVPPMHTTEPSRLRDVLHKITSDPSEGGVSFTTEGSTFSGLGINSIVCGPGSIDQAHQANEFIRVSEFDKGPDFVQTIIRELCL